MGLETGLLLDGFFPNRGDKAVTFVFPSRIRVEQNRIHGFIVFVQAHEAFPKGGNAKTLEIRVLVENTTEKGKDGIA